MAANCMQCKHYFVTYDKYTPRGCRIYKIQSATLPSQVVKRANDGEDCIGFSPKDNKQQKGSKRDLNNPKYW